MDAAFVAHTALFDGAVENVLSAGCADRFGSVTQKEPRNIISPFTLTLRPPVVSQLLEQTVTQWQDALLAALALADSQLHPGSVNVSGLQMPCFRQSESAAINGHQKRPVARLTRRAQDRFHLATGVDFGAPDGVLHSRDRRHQLISLTPKGNAVEKAYGIDSDVNAGSRKLPLLDQVIEPVRDLFVRNQFRRTVIIACKLRDVSAVRLLSAFCPATNGKISDVFCAKWCCHKRLLCRLWIHRRRQPLTGSAKRLRSTSAPAHINAN